MAFPLFKGITRPAMLMGVPVTPFIIAFVSVAFLAMAFHLLLWLLAPVLIFIMAQITKRDNQKFRILGLFVETKLRNLRRKGGGLNSELWGGSSYSPDQSKIDQIQNKGK